MRRASVVAVLVLGSMLTACGVDPENYEIVEEHYSTTSGSAVSICTDNPGLTNADISFDGTTVSTAVYQDKKNTVVSFVSHNHDYFFSYDTHNLLDSSDAVYIVNSIGKPQGVLAYTTEGGLQLQDAKTYTATTDYCKVMGYQGKTEEDAYPYAIWVDDYTGVNANGGTLKLLLKFKTLEVENEFLKGFGIEGSTADACQYQTKTQFDGYPYVLTLPGNPGFYTYTREKDGSYVYDTYVLDRGSALVTLTFGTDYIDPDRYKTKKFKVVGEDGIKYTGMKWKQKKTWCYAVTGIQYETKQWLEEGMFLFAAPAEKNITEVLKTMSVAEQ